MDKLNIYKDIEFDGPVVENETGKVTQFIKIFFKLACIKTFDGQIVGIFESSDPEIDEDNFQIDYNRDVKSDASSQEIKNILDKFKL
mgnify:CR=1 FL=1